MTNDFDMKKLDFLINKEIDEVTMSKLKKSSSPNLLQYEFIKSLTWGDSRLKNICPNFYNDSKSPIFKTSELNAHSFNTSSIPSESSFINYINHNFNALKFEPTHNFYESAYAGRSFDNSPQTRQFFNSSFEACKSFNSPNDSFVTAKNLDLSGSNQQNMFLRSPTNQSFNYSGSSNEYNSAYSSFQMNNSFQSIPSPNQFNQSGYGGAVKRQIYQVSEEFSPVLSFDVEKKATSPGSTDNIWNKLDISSDNIIVLIERLRKYLVQTIFVRLVNEIDQINSMLISSGREDIQIGETSLATLKLLCDSGHGQVFDRIKPVLPFIEMHPNQKYLIDRIRALSFGCMSAFKWESESSVEFKIDQNNPKDTMIVMHFLRTYLDARLPQNCRILDGKTFSKMHFISFGEKIKVEEYLNSVAIVEESVNPSHFNVVSNGQIYLMKKGPTNIFQAILFFFYCIKISHQGMLRRISLGENGLNLLWIFDDL